MENEASGRALCHELISQARLLIRPEDLSILKECSESEASARLHLTLGAQIRATLGFWETGGLEKMDAISLYIDKEYTFAMDADSASGAIIRYFWKKEHCSTHPT